MNKPWIVILVLIGIFAAGGVTGGLVTVRVLRERVANRPVPEEWAPKHLKRLEEKLGLSQQQSEQVRPIIRRNMEQLAKLRNQTMAETRAVVEAMQKEISDSLTPEQRSKFEQLNRELRESREKRERLERGKRDKSDPGRPGGPPPPDQGRPPAPPPEKT